MATEPSSQATELSPAGVQQPPPISRRVKAVIVGWFLGWPFVAYAFVPSEPPISTLGAWLLGTGSFLWVFSLFLIYCLLFAMIEARWPRARTIREILSFVIGILRALGGHHSS